MVMGRGTMAAVAAGMGLVAVGWSTAGQSAAGERELPYWASISAGQARMRSGPGRQFPVTWLYQRADLPVKVIEVQPSWRRIQDVDGTTGWVMVNLLADQRTAIVRDGEQPLRAEPSPDARVVWRAQLGVVGRVSKCGGGWCRLDVKGRSGFVEARHLWGVGEGETLP